MKYKRKMDKSTGRYWIKDLNWIKNEIVKRYSFYLSDMDREMFIHIDKSNYQKLGYVFFSIEGSPPKGCAIYQPDHGFLIIIDAWGKTKKFDNTFIDKNLIKEVVGGNKHPKNA